MIEKPCGNGAFFVSCTRRKKVADGQGQNRTVNKNRALLFRFADGMCSFVVRRTSTMNSRLTNEQKPRVSQTPDHLIFI